MRALFLGVILLALSIVAQPLAAQSALTGTVTSQKKAVWKECWSRHSERDPTKSSPSSATARAHTTFPETDWNPADMTFLSEPWDT